MFHPSGTASLEALGVLDRVLATGAPPLRRGSFTVGGARLGMGAEMDGAVSTPHLCVRRVTLDQLLLAMAEEAGVRVRTETAVTGLVQEDGVVSGVRTEAGPVTAPVVVGADGPRSTVARLVGAREYHVTRPGRFFLWAYFEGVAEREPHARLGKVDDTAFLAMPTDGGLHLAGVGLPMASMGSCLADVDGSLSRGIACVEEVADLLQGSKRVGPIRVMHRWHGYFREACGPGWVLVGDAGHFKDPTPAQGMQDALRQGERLAAVIERGLGPGHAPDFKGWWQWRDEDAWEMYWFANLMGAPGPTPRVAARMFLDLSREPDGAEKLLRVLNHDIPPSAVFSNRRGLRTVARAAASEPRALPALLRESAELVVDGLRHQRMLRRPVFTPPFSAFPNFSH
jgi:flavin-dependent dehydrogenase